MFKKLLVPLDGSELAERALEPANRLTAGGGELTLLRVTTAEPTPLAFGQTAWPAAIERRSEAAVYLEAVAARLARPGLSLDILAAEGDPASLIVETASSTATDLIVMSTHGYSGLTRWLLGSVTERVLQQAPCPVLAVRSAEALDTLLITLDGSALAESVLPLGMALAQSLGSRVHLLSVAYEPGVELLGFDPAEPVTRRGESVWNETAQDRAETYLRDIQARLAHGIPNITLAVRYGPPALAILEYAEQHGVKVILMATHGLTGLRRWVFGSVTQKVLRAAPCALFIAPPKQTIRHASP